MAKLFKDFPKLVQPYLREMHDEVCFNKSESNDDGNPEVSRDLTSATALLVTLALFYWLTATIVDEYKPGRMPNPIPLSNTPFFSRVFGAAQLLGTLLCMFLWRSTNVYAFYVAYLAALTVTQCYAILFHVISTSLLNNVKKPALAVSLAGTILYVTFAHGTPAIYHGPLSWLKWLVYDTLWFYALYLVYLDVQYKPTLLLHEDFMKYVKRLVITVIISYIGWCLASWWDTPADGISYSIWIFFVTLVFIVYAQFNDFLYHQATKTPPLGTEETEEKTAKTE